MPIFRAIIFFVAGFLTMPLMSMPLSPSASAFYGGGVFGYGATTWSGLIPSTQNQNVALSISTPKEVEEGGLVWGVVAGYEWTPFFAVEALYRHYPNASVKFDADSIFAFEHDDRLFFRTDTESVNLMAKLMIAIPHVPLRAFSSFGLALVRRTDEIMNQWRGSPSFGMGINHQFTEHVMLEVGANYIAGNGESELNPANDYVPFLFSTTLSLAYRF